MGQRPVSLENLVKSMDRRPDFPLALLSAFNESGGGYLHRLFDGHPECFVTPFEIQLGNGQVRDGFADWFSAKYRWPVWPDPLPAPDTVFDEILDEETKGLLRAPATAKHRDFPLGFGLDDFRRAFLSNLNGNRLTPGIVVETYIKSLFACWRDREASGREWLYLGHCPGAVLDADRVLSDLPGAKIIHLVRDPLAGFADFRKRVPSMDPVLFSKKWNLVNLAGYAFAGKYPEKVRMVHFSDLLENRETTLAEILGFLGLKDDPLLGTPTWNRRSLDRMGPFGGLAEIFPAHESAAALSLDETTRETIRRETAGTRSLLGLNQTSAAGSV